MDCLNSSAENTVGINKKNCVVVIVIVILLFCAGKKLLVTLKGFQLNVLSKGRTARHKKKKKDFTRIRGDSRKCLISCHTIIYFAFYIVFFCFFIFFIHQLLFRMFIEI